MILREELEAREHELLAPYAAKASESSGRMSPDDEDALRTCFQRDRDRILHCKAFRRLSHKTQVFIGAQGDHYRTRLTHTLEVQQISRTIARALRLNEDLTEAIALGHDLGHTPFGHVGEKALNMALARYNEAHPDDIRPPFHHNEQSLRVVDVIEKDGRGLNLTAEVRDGIVHHTGSIAPSTLEGEIVATADRIAYINHDVDDSIRAGLICEEDLPESTRRVLGTTHAQRITTLVNAMVEASDGRDEIRMEPRAREAMDELRSFLFENIYVTSAAKEEDPKAKAMVATLFEYFLEHVDEIPPERLRIAEGDVVTATIDFVAGMTDRYALSRFEEIFVPKNWRG